MTQTFITIKGTKEDLIDFPRKLNDAVDRLFKTALNPLLNRTEQIAKQRLAIGKGIGFSGDLHDSVKKYKYNSARSGKIYIKNKKIQGSRDSTLNSAFQNEFGTKPYIMKFAGNPKLKRWATSKGISLNKGSLLIGGKNSRVKLGQSQNRFWMPTFVKVEMELTTIIKRVLNKELR